MVNINKFGDPNSDVYSERGFHATGREERGNHNNNRSIIVKDNKSNKRASVERIFIVACNMDYNMNE